MCSTKTDELIEMPFGLSIRVYPKNRVLAEGPDPPMDGTILGDIYLHLQIIGVCGVSHIFR